MHDLEMALKLFDGLQGVIALKEFWHHFITVCEDRQPKALQLFGNGAFGVQFCEFTDVIVLTALWFDFILRINSVVVRSSRTLQRHSRTW